MTPAEMKTAYDLLGVSSSSDAAEIKAAWRRMVRAYHPDQARADPVAANRKLAEINAAFDLLCTLTDDPVQSRSASPDPVNEPARTPAKEQRARSTALRTHVQRPQGGTAHAGEPCSKPRPRQSALDPHYFFHARTPQEAFESARNIYEAPVARAKRVAYA